MAVAFSRDLRFPKFLSARAAVLLSLIPTVVPAQSAAQGRLKTLEEVKAPISVGIECDGERSLHREIRFPASDEASDAEASPRFLITIHRRADCWTDLLTVWRAEAGQYRALLTHDSGRMSVHAFRYQGRDFVQLFQSQLSARFSWEGSILLVLTEAGDLQAVELAATTACGREISLPKEFDHSVGQEFHFDEHGLRFETAIWGGEYPSVYRKGTVFGTLALEEAGTSSGLRLVVEKCDVGMEED